jgi:signal transduction histidine kinase
MSYYALSGLVNFLTSIVLGSYLFIRGRSPTIRMFGAWCLSVAGWSFGYYRWQVSTTPEQALLWTKVLMAFAITIPVFILHFTIRFLGQLHAKRRLVWSYYGVSVGYLAADLFGGWFIAGVKPVPWFTAWPQPGFLFHPYLAMFLGAVVYSHALLWKEMQQTAGQRRTQTQYVFWGVLIAFTGGSTNFPLWYGVPIPPVGNGLVIVYVIAITYAIVRHRLMDITLAVTRTSVLLAVYGTILGVPALLATALRPSLTELMGTRWWMIPAGFYTVAALIGPFVYLYFERKVEERLLKDQRRYQQALLSASSGMTEIRELKKLLALIVRVITKTVGLTHASIFLHDAGQSVYVSKAFRHKRFVAAKDHLPSTDPMIEVLSHARQPMVLAELAARLVDTVPQDDYGRKQLWALSQMRSLNASVVVPSFMQDRLIGFLVLGEKRNSKAFTDEDLVVFSTLANQAAVAIENARFYEEERERQAALFHTASLASLGTMASSMSHQVNNRFNVVSVIAATQKMKLTQLLRSETADIEQFRRALEDDAKQFDSLTEEALNGGRIVQAIRKLTKPSRGNYQPLHLRDAIQAGLDVVQYKVPFKELDFRLEVPEDLPQVLGDQAQLGECFLNLIDNANDAIEMKQKELKPTAYRGMIWVRAYTVTEGGREWVVAEVAENGIGVPEKQLASLFVPFFTTKATINKGTGLGLYVIRKVVEAHNGTIAVTSNYGVGTTFTIRLLAVRKDETSKARGRMDTNGNAQTSVGPAPPPPLA